MLRGAYAAVVLVFFATAIAGCSSDPVYVISVDFSRSTTVPVGTEVRVGEQVVGEVTETERSGTTTRVEMEIDNDYAPVPDEAHAVLRQKTLLGESLRRAGPDQRAKRHG